MTSLDPADRAIAERIRDLLAAKPNRFFADEKEQAAVEAFYQKRNLAPLWLDKGVENARAKAVIARLKNADADGLDPSDYKTPTFAALAPDALAEAELTLTQTVLTYARHVQAGRMPHRMVREDNIGLPQRAPRSGSGAGGRRRGGRRRQGARSIQPAVRALSEAQGDAGAAARHIRPARATKSRRVRCSNSTARARWKTRAWRNCARRLGVPGEATDLRYDEKVAEAVKEYQRANDLPATGNLDATDGQEAQSHERSPHRHRDRQHGTLALVPA